jgi:DNA-directed RNA polymerase specialized sigma24 family protein
MTNLVRSEEIRRWYGHGLTVREIAELVGCSTGRSATICAGALVWTA